MSNPVATQRTAARTAGIAILLVLVTGVFAQIFVFMRLPADDAANTARNILAHETLFRYGIASALVSSLCGIVAIWALYVLLKPFRESFALLAVLFQFTGSIVFSSTIRDYFLALHLLRAESFLAPFTTMQLQSAAQLLFAHDDGLRISLVFSGLGALIFNWLLFQSRYIPRVISGYAVFADAFVILSCFSLFVAPGSVRILFPWFPLANFLAMLSLGLWLIIKGAAIYPQSVEVIA
ncbi:MAG: DUF4386 domain-containing protein [Terriglobia bacterium]